MRGVSTIVVGLSLLLGAPGMALACPEADRYPGGNDGIPSVSGGAVPSGARGADDFYIPIGNGNNYQVRVIKFLMISSMTLTPSNVGITIYADYAPPTDPTNPQPGTVVSGPPNVVPTIRGLGFFAQGIDGRPLNQYEVSYVLPPGFLTLQNGRWYWLSPWATAPVAGPPYEIAFALLSAQPVVGQPAFRANGTPPSGALGPWQSTAAVCCTGAHDLAIFLDAVQIGRRATDFDCSLAVDVADIFSFLGAWFSGAAAADFNGFGGTNVADIFSFLGAWFAGT